MDPRKVLMPPLHIKLGLMKQFVTALDKESAAFEYLRDFFPKLSEAKVKAGVFVGPQIKKILECKEFPKMLTTKEKAAWNSFVAVVRGFLGNHKGRKLCGAGLDSGEELRQNGLQNVPQGPYP